MSPPRAGPARRCVVRLPDVTNLPANGVKLPFDKRSHSPVIILRQLQELSGHLDAAGGTEPARIEFSIALLKALGEILAEVFHQSQLPVLGRALWRFYVNVSFLDHVPPALPQQINVLAATDAQMPMPGAAFLLFCNCDIGPVWHFAFDKAHKFTEVRA